MILAALITFTANGAVFGMVLFELVTTGRVTTERRSAPDYYGPWHIAGILLMSGCGLLSAATLLLRGAL